MAWMKDLSGGQIQTRYIARVHTNKTQEYERPEPLSPRGQPPKPAGPPQWWVHANVVGGGYCRLLGPYSTEADAEAAMMALRDTLPD